MSEVIDWPVDLIPSDMGLGLETMTRTFESPWTGSVQTADSPGAKVVMQVTFRNLPADKARRLEALIFSLDGQRGRVRMWDFAARPPHRPGSDTPVARTALTAGRHPPARRDEWCSYLLSLSLLASYLHYALRAPGSGKDAPDG